MKKELSMPKFGVTATCLDCGQEFSMSMDRAFNAGLSGTDAREYCEECDKKFTTIILVFITSFFFLALAVGFILYGF